MVQNYKIKRSVDILIATIVIFFIGALYWSLRLQCHSGDAIAQAIGVETLNWCFHPHHLLYMPLFVLILKVLKVFEISIRSLTVMQMGSLIFSCLSLLIFFRLSSVLSNQRLLSFFSMLILAFSNGYWHYATEGEAYNISLTFIIWIGYVLLKDDHKEPSGIYVGLLFLTALLLNQTSIIFSVILVIYSIIFRGFHWKTLLIIFAISGFGSLLVYIAVASYGEGFHNLIEIYSWMTLYLQKFHPDHSGLNEFVFGFINAFMAVPRSLFWLKIFGLILIIYRIVSLLPFWFKLFKTDSYSSRSNFKSDFNNQTKLENLSSSRELSKEKQKKVIIFCFIWAIVFCISACYWEPLSLSSKFWVPVLPPAILLIFVQAPPKKFDKFVTPIFVLILFSINLVCHALPASKLENDNSYLYAKEVYKACGQDGLVVSPYDYYVGNAYLTYYFGFYRVIENQSLVGMVYSDPISTIEKFKIDAIQSRVLVPWDPRHPSKSWLLDKIQDPERKELAKQALTNLDAHTNLHSR